MEQLQNYPRGGMTVGRRMGPTTKRRRRRQQAPTALPRPTTDSEPEEVAWRRRPKPLSSSAPNRRAFAHANQFPPGWQDELYRYKQSLRMPDSLIRVPRPTSSLPDLQTEYQECVVERVGRTGRPGRGRGRGRRVSRGPCRAERPASAPPAPGVILPLRPRLTLRDKRLKPSRRKLKSSGFDYLKKKKKYNKEAGAEDKRKRRKGGVKEAEVRERIRTWQLDKEAGETVLHRAARLGLTEVVEWLLEVDGEKAGVADVGGWTPLHEAAARGHPAVVRALLAAGADPNHPAAADVRPLHEGVESGSVEVVEALVGAGADVTAATTRGDTPLSLATAADVKKLIENYTADEIHLPAIPPSIDKAEDIKEEFGDGFEIEESEVPLPCLYRLVGEGRSSWVLLDELMVAVGCRTKDSLVRRLSADTRSLTPAEFYSGARSRTLVPGDPERRPARLSTPPPRLTLVRYTQAVRAILGVETTVVPR